MLMLMLQQLVVVMAFEFHRTVRIYHYHVRMVLWLL
jgi:hypothetical protein